MGRPSRILDSLRIAVEQEVLREFGPDIFEPTEPLTPEEELEQLRSELRNGLTDMQRLFLFGKLSGLNDKEVALAAGYSVSVAENTKQRIWKPRVRNEWERLRSVVANRLL
jgi:DNA-directed RNA polymerase specialized sigma24 family protein